MPHAALSVVLVCRNEAAIIEPTLVAARRLVGDAGDLLAIDTGSTDGTLELLAQHRCRILQLPWRGFIQARADALAHAANPWTLLLDADERPSPDMAAAISDLLQRDDPSIVGARLNRMVYYRGQPLRHVWQPEWRLRLVRRDAAISTGTEPHDKLAIKPGVQGRVVDLPGHLEHHSIADFGSFLRKQAGLARASAHALHAQGRRGSRLSLALSPTGAFLKQLVLKGGWRDGWPGWLAAASQAVGTLMKHAQLIELSHGGTPQHNHLPNHADPRA